MAASVWGDFVQLLQEQVAHYVPLKKTAQKEKQRII